MKQLTYKRISNTRQQFFFLNPFNLLKDKTNLHFTTLPY